MHTILDYWRGHAGMLGAMDICTPYRTTDMSYAAMPDATHIRVQGWIVEPLHRALRHPTGTLSAYAHAMH
eukprot:2453186-Rhodomonas_salina.6